jgi:adenine-specific DNA methylase
LDPPYIRSDRHTETYAQRYHFLDGLGDPRRWQQQETAAREGLFQSSTMKEPWSDKGKFADLLEQLLSRHSASIVVMSYMESGIPSAKELRAIFAGYFSSVRIFTTPVQRVLSNTTGAELLIVGRP